MATPFVIIRPVEEKKSCPQSPIASPRAEQKIIYDKLLILTECELSEKQLMALYKSCDSITELSKFNQARRLAKLFDTFSVVIVDLRLYLRWYNENVSDLTPNVFVMKVCEKGYHIDKDISMDLRVHSHVKYLPERKKKDLATYISTLNDHMSHEVAGHRSLWDRIFH